MLGKTEWSPALRLQFDRLVLGFWNEFEAIAREQTIVPDTQKQPTKGQTWGPKYPTVAKALAEYRRRHRDDDATTGPDPAPLDLDALTAALPLTEMF